MPDEDYTEEELIARAIVRLRELFEAAPWLAPDEKPIGGCLLVTYRDLAAIQKYAERQFNLTHE